jgi:hypothetical protein
VSVSGSVSVSRSVSVSLSVDRSFIHPFIQSVS